MLAKIIQEGKYDTIVNCIGILNNAAEENKANAIYINSFLPHFIVDLIKDTNSYFIQMSTDCVFSGKKGNYIENDFKDGLTFYDRTKALGEIVDNKNVTFRASIVGPDIKENGIGLMNWFMKQKDSVNGYSKVLWTGQTTLEYAKMIEIAAKERPVGLFNMVPDESISKYDLLMLFNKYLKKDKIIVNKYDGVTLDKSLKRTNFNFSYKVPSYEEMVIELSEWMQLHKSMYPHYSM